MAKQEEQETERFHVVLFKDDLDYLRQHYGAGSAHSSVGISKVIRTIVQQRIRGLKAEALKKQDSLAAELQEKSNG